MLKDFTANIFLTFSEPHQIPCNSDGIEFSASKKIFKMKSFFLYKMQSFPFKLHFSSWQRAANKLIVLQMPGEGIDGKVCPARGLDIYLVN